MPYRRILILGCSGSGKSTFARRFGALTGLPVVHLDKLFWKPGWIQREREDFDLLLRQELQKDAWIIDGNFGRTLPMRLDYCDQAIYFDLPRLVCLWGVLTRVLKTLGTVRLDMGDGCPEKFNWAFIKYTWNFEKEQGAGCKRLIRESGKPAVTFRSRRAARRYLEGLKHDDAVYSQNDAPSADNS